MADGFAAIDRQVARFRELARLPRASAPDAAAAVRADLLAHAARAETPDGKPWPETADGHPPLRNVASALRVEAVGASVVCSLEGRHARHHHGRVRGGVRRQVLPTSRIPTSTAVAIRGVLVERFRRTMEIR